MKQKSTPLKSNNLRPSILDIARAELDYEFQKIIQKHNLTIPEQLNILTPQISSVAQELLITAKAKAKLPPVSNS